MYNALEGTKSKLDTTNKGVFFFLWDIFHSVVNIVNSNELNIPRRFLISSLIFQTSHAQCSKVRFCMLNTRGKYLFSTFLMTTCVC